MRLQLSLALAAVSLISWPLAADAQDLRTVFKEVSPTVVVIRASGQEITSGGTTRFLETGSGVLISQDGKVMTAAHVVHAMSDIKVQFLGGETVTARIVASEPAADLSLLQLERVPPEARVARMADSNKVQVGEQVVIVGAPFIPRWSGSSRWGGSARDGRPTPCTRACRSPNFSRRTPPSIPGIQVARCSTSPARSSASSRTISPRAAAARDSASSSRSIPPGSCCWKRSRSGAGSRASCSRTRWPIC